MCPMALMGIAGQRLQRSVNLQQGDFEGTFADGFIESLGLHHVPRETVEQIPTDGVVGGESFGDHRHDEVVRHEIT